jgi:hypothetical protein
MGFNPRRLLPNRAAGHTGSGRQLQVAGVDRRLANDPPLHSWYPEALECLDRATHRPVRMVLKNLAKGLRRLRLQD